MADVHTSLYILVQRTLVSPWPPGCVDDVSSTEYDVDSPVVVELVVDGGFVIGTSVHACTTRGGFRHVQHVRPNRGPHKNGAPT